MKQVALFALLLPLTACGVLVGGGDHHLAADPDANDAAPASGDAGSSPSPDVDASGPKLTVLASGQHSPRSVTVDTDAIYWINAASGGVPGQIMRLARTPGAKPTVLVDDLVAPNHLHTDPRSTTSTRWLFYTENGNSPGLFQIPTSGGKAITYDHDDAAFQHVWMASVAVSEVVDRSTGLAHLHRIDIGPDPTPASSCTIYESQIPTTFPAAFTNADDIWFEDRQSKTIFHASTDCGASAAEPFVVDQTAVAMTFNTDYLYWVNETGEVRRLALTSTNGAFEEFLVPGLTTPSGLVFGGQSSLVLSDSGSGKIWRVSRSLPPVLLAEGQAGPQDIHALVGGSSVIWANEMSGEIVQCDY